MKLSKEPCSGSFSLLSPPSGCEVLQTYMQAREQAKPASMKSTNVNTSTASAGSDILVRQILENVHNEAVSSMLI
jgi:hypothetical protein